MKKVLLLLITCLSALPSVAQVLEDDNFNAIDPDGNVYDSRRGQISPDSLGTDKEIPEGLYVWTVDRRFGDRTMARPDTLQHMFMNSIFTTGLRGEYNTLGNLGSARLDRIFIDRRNLDRDFMFTNPYDFAMTPIEDFHFTNTLSPLTNVAYNTCGNRTNGEDHLKLKFATNAGKRIGVGFLFDYLYGRGYYDSQSTSHFNYTMFGSYIGDRYQAHLLFSTLHQKVAENGGITNDNYITHPETFNESFATSEIPTMLERNWNRNDNQHLFFTHRYIIGFNRKVPMTAEEIKARKFAIASQKEKEAREARQRAMREARDNGEDVDEDDVAVPGTYAGRPEDARIAATPAPADSTSSSNGRVKVESKAAADSILTASKKQEEDTAWVKNEYVPVTSFIHTLEMNNYRRIYQAYETPENYYLNTYNVAEKFSGDSIYDKTRHWSIRNTFAVSLLEGFNKYVKAGAKAFIAHTMNHYTLPDSAGTAKWNENSVSVGGQISKTQGRMLHFNVTGEVAVAGYNSGEIHIDGGVDLNFPLFKDTMSLVASGFYHHEKPAFYNRHYQSRHLWWNDDDMSMTDHFHAQGVLSYTKTRTRLRFAFDELKNYAYFAVVNSVADSGRFFNAAYSRQTSDPITVLTAEIAQDFTLGPLNWESVVTVQKSTKQEILPVPSLNIYTNLYLHFKIARVLNCDFGADMRYFTKYEAPDYFAPLGQYAVQGNDSKVKVGGYPLVNVYLNFKLSKARFFVMLSHVNSSMGNNEYFFTPHYPLNGRLLRFGISWNFAN